MGESLLRLTFFLFFYLFFLFFYLFFSYFVKSCIYCISSSSLDLSRALPKHQMLLSSHPSTQPKLKSTRPMELSTRLIWATMTSTMTSTTWMLKSPLNRRLRGKHSVSVISPGLTSIGGPDGEEIMHHDC